MSQSISIHTRIIHDDQQRMSFWYDQSLLNDVESKELFNQELNDYQATHQKGNLADNEGRGAVRRVNTQAGVIVVKHYHRGGMLARWRKDRYFGWHLAHTRAWCEWQVLARLVAQGLPVPRPAAGCVRWHYPWYRCDLATCEIQSATSLASHVSTDSDWGDEQQWRSVGKLVGRLTQAQVYHPDLNLSNVLRDEQGLFFAIDFDRAKFYHQAKRRQGMRMLQRLSQSMRKLGLRHHEQAFIGLTKGFDEHNP